MERDNLYFVGLVTGSRPEETQKLTLRKNTIVQIIQINRGGPVRNNPIYTNM
jgi:hypothetical protein